MEANGRNWNTVYLDGRFVGHATNVIVDTDPDPVVESEDGLSATPTGEYEMLQQHGPGMGIEARVELDVLLPITTFPCSIEIERKDLGTTALFDKVVAYESMHGDTAPRSVFLAQHHEEVDG